MDENNVFNSFSFQKWADYVRKEKIENEILRQRMEQVTRLRAKLIRERHLRDQADLLTDEDIDKLIGYLGAGYSLNNAPAAVSSNNGNYVRELSATYTRPNNQMETKVATIGRLSEKFSSPDYIPKDDEYIFNEIKQFYAKTHSLSGLHGTIPVRFKYNHRFTSVSNKRYKQDSEHPKLERRTVNPKSRFFEFAYNRRFND